MQLALDVHHGYENVDAQCPYCLAWHTYNKATDLEGDPSHLADEVACKGPECGLVFRLIGNCNHPFELLLWDAHALHRKQYHAAAVLLAAQAFEVFSAFYARQSLLYAPAGPLTSQTVRAIVPVARQLREAIDALSFQGIVNLLLTLALPRPNPFTLADSALFIRSIKPPVGAPSDSAIQAHPNARLSDLLLRAKRTQVGRLRNRSVHKDAYRPSATQSLAAVTEAGDILFPLSVHLGLSAAADPFGPGGA